jgi:hypothetical protein
MRRSCVDAQTALMWVDATQCASVSCRLTLLHRKPDVKENKFNNYVGAGSYWLPKLLAA